MSNSIDLSHIGLPGMRPANQPERKRQEQPEDRSRFAQPGRAEEGFVPPQGMVDELIKRALTALKQGVFWQRGSIVNIVV